MGNRFFTILIIPEKTSRVKRLIIPNWVLRGTAVGLAFTILLSGMMVFNYWYVMSQIGENKQLKMENRHLRQQVQVFENKMTTAETTMERIKTFATRLKVILHVEEQGAVPESQAPNANHELSELTPLTAPLLPRPLPSDPQSPSPLSPGVSSGAFTPKTSEPASNPVTGPAPGSTLSSLWEPNILPFDLELQEQNKQFTLLENRIDQITHEAFQTEELLQDQYEILYDKKAFLAALPTRQPALGYFTSGFGVRTSPYGDRVKMHEGLDIANRLGTVVRAPANGEVTYANSKAGYGLTVILNHGYGIETWYGHLKKFIVKPGTQVKRGDKIALLGNSGRSTGPHVHYEVRVRGYPVDPRSYIIEDPTP